jgi:hypothetical protein
MDLIDVLEWGTHLLPLWRELVPDHRRRDDGYGVG